MMKWTVDGRDDLLGGWAHGNLGKEEGIGFMTEENYFLLFLKDFQRSETRDGEKRI